MLLADIREYLRKRGTSSLQDVATHFDIAPDTARFALNYWQKKGKVREQAAGCGSGGCGGCASSGSPVFEWVQRDVALRWVPFRRS